jgi:hypothetical protein
MGVINPRQCRTSVAGNAIWYKKGPLVALLAFLLLSLFGSFSLAGNVILGENGYSVEVLAVCSAFSNSFARRAAVA